MQIIRAGVWPTMGQPWWVAVAKCPFTVGRDPSCELRLDDPGVSSRHLEVIRRADGFGLKDLGSTNGTRLDGRLVREAELEPGQPFELGGYTLRLYGEEFHRLPAQEAQALVDRLLARGSGPQALEIARAWALAAPREPRAQAALALGLALANRGDEAGEKAGLALALGLERARADFLRAGLLEAQGRPEPAREKLAGLAGAIPGDLLERYRRRLGEKIKVYAKVSRFEQETPPGGESEAQAVLQAGPFSIRFDPSRHGDLVLKAHAPLLRAAEEIRARLDFWPDRVDVVFSDTSGEESGWQAALFDGAIRVDAAAFLGKDPNFLLVALAHEYVHLAVDRLSGGRAPAWLDEGLAQYLSQNLRPTDGRLLARALEKDALLPLALLEEGFGGLERAGLLDLAYAQAHSLAEYLVDAGGWSGVKQALADLGQGQGPGKALEPWGGEPERLELNWRKWLG